MATLICYNSEMKYCDKHENVKYASYYDSPLGRITLGSDGEALTRLWLGDLGTFGDFPGKVVEAKEVIAFAKATEWLDIYFTGRAPDFTPPLATEATPFRRIVWDILMEIPFGQTMTYGQIAEMVAKRRGLQRMSAQAVGGAVGHNPISLIIPCHRVVGADGSLTGYAEGIEKKEQLLRLEGVDMSRFFVPTKGTAL